MQVMRNMHEAKNMALKAEFMMQDRGRYESVMRNFSGENFKAPMENKVTISEIQPCKERFRKDKAAGK